MQTNTSNDLVQPTTSDVRNEEVHYDDNGRVIIRPLGKGWMPNHYPTEVIGTIIRRQFRGLYHPYEAVPKHMQHIWWDEFKVCIHHVFNQV
ncbi:hypothetical protein DEO72_LG3g1570 [Vigna unguiculata]|uniref:Uncharacterized protein n=1 Tax=Vigna unguiculata TaxID=3917 RepID=A0A4D6LEK0_VIGUN|nr:hypothetical protein DEO72_LG3g1570 [Vigna unguiculata]